MTVFKHVCYFSKMNTPRLSLAGHTDSPVPKNSIWQLHLQAK